MQHDRLSSALRDSAKVRTNALRRMYAAAQKIFPRSGLPHGKKISP
jgi:hypothetical protein